MQSSGNWIIDILNYTLNFWSDAMRTIWNLLTTTPQNVNGGAVWRTISNIQGGLKAIAYALLVLFFIVGVVKTTTNFAEIKRPEVALKLFIRFAVAKAVVGYSMDILTGIFKIGQGILNNMQNQLGQTTSALEKHAETLRKQEEEKQKRIEESKKKGKSNGVILPYMSSRLMGICWRLLGQAAMLNEVSAGA